MLKLNKCADVYTEDQPARFRNGNTVVTATFADGAWRLDDGSAWTDAAFRRCWEPANRAAVALWTKERPVLN